MITFSEFLKWVKIFNLQSGGGGGGGDVTGPASAVDGNLAVYDGPTGKIIKDGGASPVPSTPSNNLYWAPNQFLQNGTATDGSAIVTDLGSTSRMYVGMTVLGSTFPLATILSIDSDTQVTLSGESRYTGAVTLTFQTDREGSDTTGTGQITNPFLTYEEARRIAVALGAGQGNAFNLIFLGNSVDLGTFNISPYVNIDFNGAFFSMDSIATVGGWDDGDSKIVMQNGQLISTWNLDTSALGALQKQILWRNIWAQNGGIDIVLKGNGSEYFCIANDTATDAFTFYVNKIQAENFSLQFESWVTANSDGIQSTNTSDTAGLFNYFGKDIYSNVTIVTTGTQSNVLQTRACAIGGSITIDGSNAVWQPDTLSNKAATLLNGAAIDFSVIQQTLWPILSANMVGPFTPGPGGAAVVSGTSTLDTYASFTNNSGYTIPLGQSGEYEILYNAETAATINGNYSMDLFLNLIPAETIAASSPEVKALILAGDLSTVLSLGTPVVSSSVKEQMDFNTVGRTLLKSFSGSVPQGFNAGDFIMLFAQNNGDMDVDVNTANLSIKRIY